MSERQRKPCQDARGVEGWTCRENDGTGLWCDACMGLTLTLPTPHPSVRTVEATDERAGP